jgi:hypothetical protein
MLFLLLAVSEIILIQKLSLIRQFASLPSLFSGMAPPKLKDSERGAGSKRRQRL